MSKLESAFSKALKEKSPEPTQDATSEPHKDATAVPLNISTEKAVANRTGLNELVSSRTQIRQMADGGWRPFIR
ncbi:MAG: hypothetical protein WDZ30_11580 [Cellvibrionaceae bacterium]